MEDNAKVTKISFDPLSKEVVDTTFYIHQTLGSGLLESIYEECFAMILARKNIPFSIQKPHDVYFEGERLKTALRLDLVVNDQIVVELKSVDKCTNAHTAQILTYMNTGNYKTGFLINFGEPYFKKAIQRFVI